MEPGVLPVSRAVIFRADARHIPLPDDSVDLIVTSPPYWQLRRYSDGGTPYDGQLGSEGTWQEWVANLVDCTREWMRVLKPAGSLFINIGDKYGRSQRTQSNTASKKNHQVPARNAPTPGLDKSLLGLPWRYALACMDELGLILRSEIIWYKINGLPESVTDRVKRSHEQLFHFVMQPKYYSCVDEIRVQHSGSTHPRRKDGGMSPKEASAVAAGHRRGFFPEDLSNPLGKLPESVWPLRSEPSATPGYVEGEHYAAFPTALVRPCVLGFSPAAICTVCGQGRVPVVARPGLAGGDNNPDSRDGSRRRSIMDGGTAEWDKRMEKPDYITGYVCKCTPYTDHPENRRPGWNSRSRGDSEEERRDPGSRWQPHPPGGAQGVNKGAVKYHIGDSQHKIRPNGKAHSPENFERLLFREYHDWEPPPSRPGVVLDPFGGTGTTALVAVAYGRIGISSDLSMEYCKQSQWRVRDGAERAVARGEKRTPKDKRLNEHLYGDLYDELDAMIAEGP